ncbi:unnamed protein product [Pedinophyceae sp. YPF-701]|nr:unnamed protein product [Pedinophyceae sp. YPF-701]
MRGRKKSQRSTQLIAQAPETPAGPMRATSLVMPGLGCAADVLRELRAVLVRPAVRDNLRSLSLVGIARDTAAELHGSLREMPALRALAVRGEESHQYSRISPIRCSQALCALMCECTSLERIDLCKLEFGADTTDAVLDWLAGAEQLRHLRLDGCDGALVQLKRRFASHNPLRRLRVFDAAVPATVMEPEYRCAPQLMNCAWKGIPDLEQLSLQHYDFNDSQRENEAVAQLLRTTTRLRRLDVGADFINDGSWVPEPIARGLSTILAALGDNKTVEVAHFRISWYLVRDPTAMKAFAAALRSNTTLKELQIRALIYEVPDSDEGEGVNEMLDEDPDRCQAATQDFFAALGDSTSLETVVLPRDILSGLRTNNAASSDAPEAAVGAGIARSRTLRRLELAAWDLSRKGVWKLARGLAHVKSLRSLAICLGREEAKQVAALDGLWKNKVDDDPDRCRAATQSFLVALGDSTSLETVVLPTMITMNLGDGDADDVAVSDAAAAVVGAGIARSRTLRRLELGASHLSRKGVWHLARGLAHITSLRSLDIRLGNEDQVLALLDGMWTNKACRSQLAHLTVVDGRETSGSRVAEKLAGVLVLEQCTLQKLEIALDLQVQKARVLCEALKVNTSLVTLDLTSWPDPDFQTLRVPPPTEDAMMALLGALEVNTTLRWVRVERNPGTQEPSPVVRDALARVHAHVAL